MNKFLIASLVAASAIASGTASATDYKVGPLEIEQPWSRALPKGATVAAGYLKVKNTGTEPDRLVGGSTPVAGKFEIHEMTMDKGVMRMRPLTAGIEIKPGETVELKPSGTHIMMMDVKQPIVRGKPFKGSLTFEKAGAVDVDFEVEAVGGSPAAASAAPAAPAHDMQHMHH
jgi:copper(I)-binding protein